MDKLIVLTLAIFFCASLAEAQAQQPCQPPAPLAVSRERNIFTEQQESDLGDAIAEHLQRDFRVIDDEQITGYLNRIGQRIIKHLPPTSLRFQFFLVDIPDVNAFVLPGGRIYVSRKLVALAQSEDEVAGVIGHEIGHLVARQQSISMTRLFREVLGVTEVKDRRDIFEKYLQLVENVARKPKVFSKGEGHEEKDQIVADQIGLFAGASAGYDPQGNMRFFDRLTENKGDTGSFFSNLFGVTKPEAKRVREMIKAIASLPPSCIEARFAAPGEEFQKWQAAVVNYTGPGRRESLHAVVKKITLDPPLRGEINHIRFSPDGKFVLAQDDSGINVLTREPFAFLFRIEAAEAKPAQFSLDSQDVMFFNPALRVEVWNVAAQKLKVARELFARKGCIQTQLSPDGKFMACLDSDLSLNLFDVDSGAQMFQKKSFYTPDMLEVFIKRLQAALNADGADEEDFEWINMDFSPDARYFAAGVRSTRTNIVGSVISEAHVLGVDLKTREPIILNAAIKQFLAGGFAFIAPDRLAAITRENLPTAAVVSFPAGEFVRSIPYESGKLTAPARGNYVLIRPIATYAVGVLDLSTKKIVVTNKQSAFDIFDQVYVSERRNGELGLYGVAKNDMQAKVVLPRNLLGRLRAATLSADMKWLAVSERARGAVWDLTKGERVFHVRGFRGGHFTDDGSLYIDFPEFEGYKRTMGHLDLTQRNAPSGSLLKETRATQYGPFVVSVKPAKEHSGSHQDFPRDVSIIIIAKSLKDLGGYQQNVILEVRDVRTSSLLWSKPFPKEAPQVWMDSQEQAMALSWPISSEEAKAKIKSDAALSKQLATMNEKEGDYFLQVFDARTGKVMGQLLIETGKGSFRISHVTVAGDWVVISDTQNRILIYSLSSGEQKGKVFGSSAIVNQAGKLLCVENEGGQLTLYDLASMEKRDQFIFSAPLALAQFSPEGKSLFVLTANQTAYVLDVSALIR